MHPLAFSLALLAPAVLGGLGDAELASALHGDVPLRIEAFTTEGGKSAGRGMGAIVIDRPIAAVWATIANYEDKAEWQPRVKSVSVLEKRPDRLRVRMEIDAAVTTARYTGWFRLDEQQHAITWTLDHTAPDNTVADVDGEYRLYALDPGRTLLVYRTYVDAGRSVPKFVQDFLTRRSIPNLLRATKKRVESGGTWKK